MMPQMETVDLPPEGAQTGMIDERGPSFKGPVLDGMEDLVDQQGRGQGATGRAL